MAVNTEQTSREVFPWLKTLPLAPEYHPTLAEFQDPISYIFKIEPEASKYGICKIVPPVPPNPKKTAITNLNRSLAARAGTPKSEKSPPTFTTRQQQIGFCPRKPRPVQRPVWQSGEHYTFGEFESKAKAFEKSYLNKCSRKRRPLSPLEIETLYWKASVDKPFSVEYANDMPGSAFAMVNTKKCREAGEAVTLGDTAWNMRGVSRAKGSLLRFMKEEIPGVTSPMVYVAMMFSWFAWHVEDHDLHSLNYMHMGGGKTWYGVPREAAVAFEEVVRVHGYGGEINPLVTFATLSEKTTVMSPEVFLKAGIPCCRLVQNAGEFVVTFPRAYHSGFSHGFNCGEAANIATPEWLRFAKDAAIRRASINYPPMVSHFQLLYDLALALSSRASISDSAEPRSSRLKDKKKGEGETMVKELFVKSVILNNELLHTLGEGSSVVILPQNSSDISVRSNLQVGSSIKVKSRLYLGLCNQEESRSLVSNRIILDSNKGGKHIKGYYTVKEKFASPFENNKLPSLRGDGDVNTPTSQAWNIDTERDSTAKGDGLSDQRLFSCTKCGILNYTCVAIVQPKEEAARYLMSADCSFLNDLADDSERNSERVPVPSRDENTCKLKASSERMAMIISNSLYDIPVQSSDYEIQGAHKGNEVVSDIDVQEDTSTTALSLLALNYGNSSDSEDDQAEPDTSDYHDNVNGRNFTPESRYQYSNSALSSPNQDLDEVPVEINSTECSVQFETDDLASIERNGTEYTFTDLLTNSNFSYPNVPLESRPRDDSSRMHVFCLEHAVEVEQQLRQIGGVHISLLCNPDYPRLEGEAKLVAEELKLEHEWKDVLFRNATREDEERIQSALGSEEAVPGNGDWAVKLGINLYYSAILSRSALYSKQMPYNSVIYNAFGCDSQAKTQSKPKVYYGKRPTRQKKIVVAGKWCGKVWMSNQVHPLLLLKESDEKEQEQVEEKSLYARPDFDEKPERKSKTPLQYSRKVGNKRKMAKDCVSIKKTKIQDRDTYSDDSMEYCPPQREFRPVKKVTIQDHDTYSDDSMEDDSPPQQEFRSIKKSKKCPQLEDLNIDTTHYDSPEDSLPPPDRRSLRSKQKKEESPPPPLQKKSKQNFKSYDDSYIDDDLEGGPSTRLRKRKIKPQQDPVWKPVIKKEIIGKKAVKSPLANKGVKIKNEKMTNEGANYMCDLDGCNMTFGSKQELAVHKRNICPVRGCGKKFFSHKYLVQHRRVHIDDRPLKCPWKGCKMTFKWSWSRTEHIRVHTGARPYVCGESGCGQTFRFVSDFSRHKRKTGHSRKKAKARGVK